MSAGFTFRNIAFILPLFISAEIANSVALITTLFPNGFRLIVIDYLAGK
jgi:hypothetical protein